MKYHPALRYSSSVVCIFLLLMTCLPATFSASDNIIGTRRQPLSELNQTKEMQTAQQMQELSIQRERSFSRTRELLKREGVPFDPDELLDPNCRQNLAPAFEKM